mmetsp:Transcript_29072/g.74806  ORF Transcript_29072/g.74806 Transcript_29072/m.74806 type:complete len:104 (-) Transcript_29072:3787-4098(-)
MQPLRIARAALGACGWPRHSYAPRSRARLARSLARALSFSSGHLGCKVQLGLRRHLSPDPLHRPPPASACGAAPAAARNHASVCTRRCPSAPPPSAQRATAAA